MGSFLEKYNDPKKLDPFARANSVRACSDGPPPPPLLDRVDSTEGNSSVLRKKLARLAR